MINRAPARAYVGIGLAVRHVGEGRGSRADTVSTAADLSVCTFMVRTVKQVVKVRGCCRPRIRRPRWRPHCGPAMRRRHGYRACMQAHRVRRKHEVQKRFYIELKGRLDSQPSRRSG